MRGVGVDHEMDRQGRGNAFFDVLEKVQTLLSTTPKRRRRPNLQTYNGGFDVYEELQYQDIAKNELHNYVTGQRTERKLTTDGLTRKSHGARETVGRREVGRRASAYHRLLNELRVESGSLR